MKELEPYFDESLPQWPNTYHDNKKTGEFSVWDEINDEWYTGERALRSGVGKGDWHVVLQDDAVISAPNEFYDNLVGALSAVPERSLVSLYTGTGRPLPGRVKAAVDKAYHATWLKHYLLLWGVGIAIPSDHIEPMLEFVADRDELYDTRIGMFYHGNRLPVYYTAPSLVDHDDDISSLLGHGVGVEARVAHRLAHGLVAWNKKVIEI